MDSTSRTASDSFDPVELKPLAATTILASAPEAGMARSHPVRRPAPSQEVCAGDAWELEARGNPLHLVPDSPTSCRTGGSDMAARTRHEDIPELVATLALPFHQSDQVVGLVKGRHEVKGSLAGQQIRTCGPKTVLQGVLQSFS